MAGDCADNVVENAKAVKSSVKQGVESKSLSYEEKERAYRKAEATYESNQQLLKDAAPNQTISLKDAKNCAKAENDLMASYLKTILRQAGYPISDIKKIAGD